ncbi:CRISPR-associated endonuclease Cas2 [uncultured Anaerovibrio sp.]|uniref:CRISPR-associated endonuclease Cas2 n=1 Tax=uncultured Anaerovibrio sp. TaxID=361586 RepID=UPI00261BAB0B|nr:CRISPR-associated endonuclease Cas2 [uncultured Anaerovibrio sp.]
MVIISYDIKEDKLRTKFNRYIRKFGGRLQYSVYEIKNSNTVLDNIIIQIKNNFEKKFSDEDSIMIMKLSKNCEITRFGYAKHDEEELIIV